MYRCTGRALLPALLATSYLAACSTVEKLQPDDTPKNPTAVLETHMVNNGLKGLFPSESTTRTYTRADRKREDERMKGTGTFSKYIIGSTDESTIVRLDRKLVWDLDPKEKTYTECPLKGCGGVVAEKPKPEKKPEQQQPAEKKSEPDCKMKIAKASFTVKPTGQKKTINEFDAEQYQVLWLVTLQDPKKRESTSTLGVDVWTTPYTQPLKDAMAVEGAYAKSFANALVSIATGGQKTQVVPEDAARLINGYVAQYLTPADRAAFLKAGKEMDKIKGYPVMIELAWNFRGEACAEAQAKADEEHESTPTSKGDLLSSVTSFFAKKKTDEMTKEMADKPILSFMQEVKVHKVEGVHDSVFSPPRNFTLANPKQ